MTKGTLIKVGIVATTVIGAMIVLYLIYLHNIETTRQREREMLYKTLDEVISAAECLHQTPPARMPELIAWLKRNEINSASFVDYRNKTIVDIWGNEVILLSRSGTISSLGSSGPDRVWQNGGGDDVVVTVDEVKRFRH